MKPSDIIDGEGLVDAMLKMADLVKQYRYENK
jgi:hypothetical protein